MKMVVIGLRKKGKRNRGDQEEKKEIERRKWELLSGKEESKSFNGKKIIFGPSSFPHFMIKKEFNNDNKMSTSTILHHTIQLSLHQILFKYTIKYF